MIRAVIVLWLAMACSGIGNVFLKKGMHRVGPLESYQAAFLLRYFLKSATHPQVVLGVVISIAYFFLWLVVLSWADLSWALPMNAVEYVAIAFLAMIFLGEKIGWRRWIGIGLISVGVILMMKSW